MESTITGGSGLPRIGRCLNALIQFIFLTATIFAATGYACEDQNATGTAGTQKPATTAPEKQIPGSNPVLEGEAGNVSGDR